MEEYYTETRDIALDQEIASGTEEKVILAFNLLNPGESYLKEEKKKEKTNKKMFSLREGLENLRKEVKDMGMAEFLFWIVNTFLLFLIVLKEFILI